MIIIIIFFPIKIFFFWEWLSFKLKFLELNYQIIILLIMDTQTYSCKKCGLTISSTCSKCDRVVDVKVMDDGCLVQVTKCSDCANVPVIKDICATQK